MASSSQKKSKSKSATKAEAKEDILEALVFEDDTSQADTDTADGKTAESNLEEALDQTEEIASDGDANDLENSEALQAPSEAAQAEPNQSNPFWGLVLGGLIAAGLGFLLAQVLQPADDGVIAQQLSSQSKTLKTLTAETAGLDRQISEKSSQIAALKTEVETLRAELDRSLSAPNDAEISTGLAALIQRQKDEIATLHNDLKSLAAFAEGQIASAQEETEAAVRAKARAKARDALNTVRLALARGESFEATLPDLASAAEVPAALSAVANGVATQSDLQNTFASAARAALSASNRELAGDGASERLSLFLQDMIGTRSLTPQEGDSPDAVLSRVEAAVKQGDLAEALTTLETLPDSGKTELAEWREKAQARKDALQAFSNLTDALSAD